MREGKKSFKHYLKVLFYGAWILNKQERTNYYLLEWATSSKVTTNMDEAYVKNGRGQNSKSRVSDDG